MKSPEENRKRLIYIRSPFFNHFSAFTMKRRNIIATGLNGSLAAGNKVTVTVMVADELSEIEEGRWHLRLKPLFVEK